MCFHSLGGSHGVVVKLRITIFEHTEQKTTKIISLAVFFCEGNIINIEKLEFELDQEANKGNELLRLIQVDLCYLLIYDTMHLTVVDLIFNFGRAPVVVIVGIVSSTSFFDAF